MFFKPKSSEDNYRESLRQFEDKFNEFQEACKHYSFWINRAEEAANSNDNLALIKFINRDFNHVVRSIAGWQEDYKNKVFALNTAFCYLQFKYLDLKSNRPIFMTNQKNWVVYLSSFALAKESMQTLDFCKLPGRANKVLSLLYKHLTEKLPADEAVSCQADSILDFIRFDQD